MRVENSIRNIKYNLLAQIMNLIVQFVSRTLFVKILGSLYLGLNGLFTNVITLLSLADMGIDAVLVYSMYKPLYNKDEKKLKELTNTYKKIYNCISLVIFIVGCAITPFLNYLIKDVPSIPNLKIIFLLYLMNTVVSYLCFYKVSIIIADQKNYIVNMTQQIFNLFANVLMIVALAITHNFFIYLIVQIIFSMATNVYLSKRAEKMYPFIKDNKYNKLPKSEIKKLRKDTFAMLLHKVGAVVINGTDNLVLSIIIGLESVGLYSNYLLIINAIKKFTNQYFKSVVASVGNLNVEKSSEHVYDIFKKIFYGNFLIYTFTSICLYFLFNPFIEWWIGSQYIFAVDIVVTIILAYYIDGMRQTVILFKESMGIFCEDQLKPVISSILNIVVSVYLAKRIGIIGVFYGTIISTFFVCVWYEASVLYSKGFHKSILNFVLLYFKYVIIGLISFVLTFAANLLITGTSLYILVIRFIVTMTVSGLSIVLLTCRMKEFKYFINLITNKLKLNKKRLELNSYDKE